MFLEMDKDQNKHLLQRQVMYHFVKQHLAPFDGDTLEHMQHNSSDLFLNIKTQYGQFVSKFCFYSL
jgi:hypothetical protein